MVKKTKRSIQWVKKKKKHTVHPGKKYAGVHLMADFWQGRIIENSKKIEKTLIGAIKASKNTPLEIIIHKFSPQGITGVILLAESHIAIHTWPELNYAAIDIFTCGDKATPSKALEYLKEQFRPKRVEIRIIKRGIL